VTRVPPEEDVGARATGPDATERTSVTGPPRYPDAEDTGVERDSRSGGGAPRWITVLGIVIAVLVVLTLIVLHLTGAVGPGVHQ
jgi:hypothetical protein